MITVNSVKMNHMVVFDFYICNQEENSSELDCDNVEFEFEFHSGICRCYDEILGTKYRNTQTCPILLRRIKGCGIRILETEYNHHSRESDAESEISKKQKKRMKMTVTTSRKPSNLPVVGKKISVLNLELSLGLGGVSSNFHGDETLMDHSLCLSCPCLEKEALNVDHIITEQQDKETLVENHLSFPQLINLFR
ncbi:uncharacterized protein LOC112085090 [Eutrema salsugineum]|uniref:uncharacterized protein LOC112085090 n=1 Tax=Eutrema salsugineum TaxID=72664 RepID=UPI000CED2F32|nr:uncharacterized protein LOC112085090 [Eutrema salsugineum]